MALKFKNIKNEKFVIGNMFSPVAAIFFSLLFFIVGVVFVFFGFLEPVLDCHKVEGKTNCLLSRQGAFPPKMHRIEIEGLSGAHIKATSGDDSDTYTVILDSETGDIPFVGYSSSGRKYKRAIVKEIKNKLSYLNDFQVVYSQKVLVIVGIIIIIFSDLILISLVKYTFGGRFVAEVMLGSGTLKIYPYNGEKKYVEERPLSELIDVYTDISPQTLNDYCTYVKTLCAANNLREPIAIKIYSKLSSKLLESGEKSYRGEEPDKKDSIIVFKFKDGSFAYSASFNADAQKAVDDFKNNLGLPG